MCNMPQVRIFNRPLCHLFEYIVGNNCNDESAQQIGDRKERGDGIKTKEETCNTAQNERRDVLCMATSGQW